jgi:hypothetical protein
MVATAAGRWCAESSRTPAIATTRSAPWGDGGSFADDGIVLPAPAMRQSKSRAPAGRSFEAPLDFLDRFVLLRIGRGWFEEYDRRLILALGAIHREVGVTDDLLRFLAVIWYQCRANRCSDVV